MKQFELRAVKITPEGERILKQATKKEIYCINNRVRIDSFDSNAEAIDGLEMLAGDLSRIHGYRQYSSKEDFMVENDYEESDMDNEDLVYWEGAGYYDIECQPNTPYYITGSERLEDEDFDLEIKEVDSNSVDQLYVLLREAHKHSVNAKNTVVDYRGNNYYIAGKIQKERSKEFYENKTELIHEALLRAKQLGVKTFFCETECCFYFELDKGQVSFHSKEHYDDMEDITTVVEQYQWSGKRDSGEIIDSYFE